MTATQAPTPGPLDSESVKLLVKGDLLWSSDTGRIGRFSDISATKPFCLHIWWSKDTYSPTHPLDGLSFVGRPDADGWMPWYGGENPVPGKRVEVRLREGVVTSSGEGNWIHDARPGTLDDIIAFRLAPTAPVEASGSELKADFVRSHPSGMDDSTYEKIEDALDRADAPVTGPDGKFLTLAQRVDTLRPQPSGETRVGYDRSDVRYGLQLIADEECDEVAASYYAKKAIDLLSARPLASGGEHSRATDFPPDDVLACVESQHSSGEGVELTFGMGTLVVNTGTFGGDNAVFIAKATAPGEVGAYTGNAAFKRDVLQPGEHVLIFPTAQQAQAVADALVGAVPTPVAETAGEALTVWYGSMPESSGRQNWTAVLGRKDATGFDFHTDGFCFARSEYPGRVLYDADHMRWVIGELAERPCVLDYDEKSHSGYVAPVPAQDDDKLRRAVEALERGIKRCEKYEHIRLGGRSETAKKAGTLRNAMGDMSEALAALKSEGK